MGAKINPKSEKCGKKTCQKSMLKFDVDFWIMVANLARFFGRFGGLGVGRIQALADFRQDFRRLHPNLTRPAPQAGVRRMKIDAKMEPKLMPKSIKKTKNAGKRHAKNDAEI